MLQISGQAWVIAISKSVAKRNEENKTNFEGAYLGNSSADSAQIWNWRCPTLRKSHRKFHVFLFRECWAKVAWKRRFLYSCKIHTCLSRVLVSWTARHTTVCLDTCVFYHNLFIRITHNILRPACINFCSSKIIIPCKVYNVRLWDTLL